MKLLLAGLALLSAGLGIALFTNYDPATLFIVGVICTAIAVIEGVRPADDRGRAVSAGDASEASSLANLQRYGSVDSSARFIDH
jgi:uncharacterized membrane protein YbhN (UPF0104 family)